ncbi:helix-turn-helix domain-containing protein [Companilactobacillus sp. DQM5]|uniref:helix-turn-helix domain-containing protein n=1 Tax=Companilactobacillus sp. DQM5 TaxID=3463359 RepID=UPI004057FC33
MYDFLSKQDQKRMDVFKYLYLHGNSHTKEVAEALDVSTSTVSKVIEDITEKNEEFKKQITELNGEILVEKLDLNALLNHYLQSSVIYEMLRSLMKTGTMSQEYFEKNLYISQPTFSRNRTRLKHILKHFNIELSSNNELIGSEYIIRKFFYFFYTGISGYLKQDKNDIKIKMHYLFEAAPFLKTNNYNLYNKMYRLLKISSLRVNQGNFIDVDIFVDRDKSQVVDKMMNSFPKYIVSTKITSEIKNKEIKYFIYTLYREYITNFNLKNEELTELFKVPDERFYKVEKDIVNEILGEIAFENKKSEDVTKKIDELVNRYHLEMMYGLIDRSFFEIVSLDRSALHAVEEKLVHKSEKIYEKLSLNKEYRNWVVNNDVYVDKDLFITDIFFLLYRAKIFQAKTDKLVLNIQRIKLLIQMSHPEIERFIHTRFELLFWNRITFVDDVSKKPDFIIADIEYPEYKGIPTYYLASIPTEQQTKKIMIELSESILDMFLERII